VVHEAEEGGFWAEVPAIPGCATEGETMEELIANLHEAIEACLFVEAPHRSRVVVDDRAKPGHDAVALAKLADVDDELTRGNAGQRVSTMCVASSVGTASVTR
jgi:hypothetical protein